MPQPLAEFEHDGVRILGYSQAGEESYIVAPEMNLGFDIGRAPRETLAVDNILLTHGHMDHAAGLAYYCSQRMFIDAAPGTIYAPEPLVAPINKLMSVWGEIDGHIPPGEIRVAQPGVDIQLRRDLIARPFLVNHPGRGRRGVIHALGYSIIEVRKKLKDDYLDLTGPQIVELKKKGVEITRRVEIPLLTTTGDTGPGDFLDHDHVRKSRILLLECTFVDPDHRDRARAGNHMHLIDLRDIIPQLENERIVLTHLTRRTPLHEARDALRREFGDQTDERITFLMQHTRRGRRARPQSEPRA